MKKAGKTLGLIGGILGILLTLVLAVITMGRIAVSPEFGAFDVRGETFSEMREELGFEQKELMNPVNFSGQRWLSEFKEFESVMNDYIEENGSPWRSWKTAASWELKAILIALSCSLVLSIFGIIGAGITKKHNIPGGIFMLLSGIGIMVCSFFAFGIAFMWLPSLLLLLGGIFALAAKQPTKAV